MKIANWKNPKRISMVVLVSLIFVASMAALAAPNIKANGAATLYVHPDYQKVSVCSIFTVDIDIDSYISGYHGVIFDLYFDPDLVECLGATNTSFPARITSFDVTIDNTIGFIRVNITANSDVFEIGTLAEITFHCKDVGISFLNLTNAALQNVPTQSYPIGSQFLYNGTVEQVPWPVGGEVLTIDYLALLAPLFVVAGTVAAAIVIGLRYRRTLNY